MDTGVKTSRGNNNINNRNPNGSTSGWVASVRTGGTDETAFKGSEAVVVATCTGGSNDVIEMAV